MGEVGRNEPRPGECGEHKPQYTLHFDEIEEEFIVDFDEPAVATESLQKRQIVSCIDDEQARQRIEKAQHEERGLQLRLKELPSGIAKQNQAPRPRRSERAGVRRVGAPVNGHFLSSPWLSG